MATVPATTSAQTSAPTSAVRSRPPAAAEAAAPAFHAPEPPRPLQRENLTRDGAMNYCLIGVNHKTAPITLREKLAISDSQLPEALLHLSRFPGVEEAMLLSTCNRVEALVRTSAPDTHVKGFFAQQFGITNDELRTNLYEHRGPDAIRHLFRVASSLDSLVIGEPQVLGQVKDAYAVARRIGTINARMDALLNRCFAVAKRVRSETQIGSSAVSIASVAVDLAKKIFGTLEGRTVYLVGAGEMSELAAKHLVANGAGAIFVANRSHSRAADLAAQFNGKAMLFEELYETASSADIVITSTGAPHAIFRREHGELFLQKRNNRPMFFIDIAVPRDVAPELNELDGIFVYDIDDLQQVVASHAADRKREADRAERIIEEEVHRFDERTQTLEVVPTIISLQEHLETIRQAEINKLRGRLGRLSPQQELAVESLSRGIINKILHAPIMELKSAAKDKQSTTLIELVRRMFQLDRRPKDREAPGLERVRAVALKSQAEAAATQELDASASLLQSQLDYIQAQDEMTHATGRRPE